MSEWNEFVLDDLCDRVTVGHVGKMAAHYESGGVPFLRSQNVNPFVINKKGLLFIGHDFNTKLRKSALSEGDVVVVRTGYPGTAAVIPAELDGANCADLVVITPSNDLNPHVLAGVFNSVYGRQTVKSQLVGSAQQHFNVGSAKAMTIRLPDRRGQDQIAEVLLALNNLIENDRRRVEVLEEIARSIYHEWFVKFRYPGHEDVPMVDSAIGPIPEGWTLSTCGDELDFIGGGTPSKKEPRYWDEGSVAWYTPSDLTKTGWRYAAEPELRITELGVAKSSARLFPAGSVMMTSRATLGVLAVATTEATTNQGFIVIRPDDRWTSGFIYEWLDSKAAELAALGTGATFKEITKGSFKRFPFVVPDQTILDSYRVATDPLESEVHVLEQQIRSLSRLRDRLLPKLVTGQINVSTLNLDRVVGAGLAEGSEVA